MPFLQKALQRHGSPQRPPFFPSVFYHKTFPSSAPTSPPPLSLLSLTWVWVLSTSQPPCTLLLCPPVPDLTLALSLLTISCVAWKQHMLLPVALWELRDTDKNSLSLTSLRKEKLNAHPQAGLRNTRWLPLSLLYLLTLAHSLHGIIHLVQGQRKDDLYR